MLKTRRGFLSQSTSSLTFGLLESKQWAGEERLLRNEDEPAEYSIAARTQVRAYEISRADARKKLPTELMLFLVRLVEQRYLWIEQRTKYLVEKSRAVASMDPSKEKYDENLTETKKRYPAASAYVINNIRKKHFLLKQQNQQRPVTIASASMTSLTFAQSFCTPSQRRGGPLMSPMSEMYRSAECSPESAAPRTFPVKPLKPMTANVSVFGGANRSSLLNLRAAHDSAAESIYTAKPALPRAMTIASGTPRLLTSSRVVVPMFPSANSMMKSTRLGTVRRAQVALLSYRGQVPVTALPPAPAQIEMRAELKQFSVGSRTIMLLGQIRAGRPPTPGSGYLMTHRRQQSAV